MQLKKIIEALEKIAPSHLAEAWDNVGLLVGDVKQEISGVMLAIDYTAVVAAEARAAGCDLMVAYHPPIFEPVKRLTAGDLIYDAIRNGMAIYSPHTALDAAEGGTNDMLADAIGMSEREPLRKNAGKSGNYKLVVFVPRAEVEQVARAIFEAGAGRIGRYSSCSFRSEGTGTFFGEEGSNPTVGQKGRLETADEIRLETLVPIGNVDSVVRALRASHPYEEPAFDLNQLAAVSSGVGQGRIGAMGGVDRRVVIERIKKELQLPKLLVAGPSEGAINRAAVCAGSGGMFLDDALAGKAELYLTGELRHHDAIKAASAGMNIICTLHSNSERAVLKRVGEKLERLLPGISVAISKSDRDPFRVI